MLPGPKDYDRVKRGIEAALRQTAESADTAIETVLDAATDVLAITGSCWHQTDPSSGVPVSSSMFGDPPGSLEESLLYEFRRPDINRFQELRARRAPVAAISTETGGELGASARFREMIEPTGVADELRVSFSDPFGIWAALVVFTGRTMTAEDLRFMAEVIPGATVALRSATAARALELAPAVAEQSDVGGPSVLILDREDRIVAADATARRRLALVPEGRDVQLPGLISCLAAQARWDSGGRAATARMRTLDGRWFVVDASLLDEPASGDVAVVMQPAAAAAVLDGVLRALGVPAG